MEEARMQSIVSVVPFTYECVTLASNETYHRYSKNSWFIETGNSVEPIHLTNRIHTLETLYQAWKNRE